MSTPKTHSEQRAVGAVPSELGKFWTVPNMLTLSRLVIAAPLAYLIFARGSIAWIVALTLAAVATDWFDGRLARWSHTVSGWGKVLDPLVDKIGGGAIVLALVVRGSLPLWFVAALFTRDLLIVLGGIRMTRKAGHIPSSILSGKVAITAVAITVLAALLEADPPIMRFCLIASTVLIAYSYLRYMGRYFRVMSAARRRSRQAEVATTTFSENGSGALTEDQGTHDAAESDADRGAIGESETAAV